MSPSKGQELEKLKKTITTLLEENKNLTKTINQLSAVSMNSTKKTPLNLSSLEESVKQLKNEMSALTKQKEILLKFREDGGDTLETIQSLFSSANQRVNLSQGIVK